MAACGVVFDRQTFLWHLHLCEQCKKPGQTYQFLWVLGEPFRSPPSPPSKGGKP